MNRFYQHGPIVDHPHARRLLLAIALATTVGASCFCYYSTKYWILRSDPGITDADSENQVTQQKLSVRDFPVPIKVQVSELARGFDTNRVERALHVATPRFREKRLPIALVLHAVRLWGKDATYELIEASPEGLGWASHDHLVDILLDDGEFQRTSAYSLQHLLVRSPWGVRVASNSDFESTSIGSTTHVGKFQDTLAKANVQSSSILRLHDGTTATVADTIVDEAVRFDRHGELDWVLQSFMLYLNNKTWYTRHGTLMDINALLRQVAERPLGVGSCRGMHVPHVLAIAIGVHAQTAFMDKSTERLVRDRLRQIAAELERMQQPDGSWDRGWYESDNVLEEPDFQDAIVRSINTVGHHLEWIAVSPRDLRPNDSATLRAIDFVIDKMPLAEGAVSEDWHNYLPISHAARSLRLIFHEQQSSEL